MLKINVGLNRKGWQDGQSTGFSINIEAELDSSLLAKPDELQAQVEGLYAQAGEALNRQEGAPPTRSAAAPAARAPVARTAPARAAAPAATGGYAPRPAQAPPATRWTGRTGATAGRVGGNAPPAATDTQIGAIRSIAQSRGVDPESEAEALGFNPNTLSRGDASRLIDHLKALPQARAAA